jgi:hypothetical protein
MNRFRKEYNLVLLLKVAGDSTRTVLEKSITGVDAPCQLLVK